MSEEKKYYCFCGSNCKYETMTKEQILAAIAQAVATGSVGDCDTGFITKVKETNNGGYVTFWVGTQAQYNALETHEKGCMYIFTDGTTDADIAAALTQAIETAEQAEIAAAQAERTAAEQAERTAAEIAGIDNRIVALENLLGNVDRWGISVNDTDMNTVKTTGFYYGYTGMANAAEQCISVWEVIAYSVDWVVQRQTVLRGDGTSKTYERIWYNGGAWSTWKVVLDTSNWSEYISVSSGGASSNGMIREFDESPSASSFTTNSTLSKFYIITLRVGNYHHTLTIDYRSLREMSLAYFYVTTSDSNPITLLGKINSNNTVTFDMGTAGTIVHICGYY